jgi:HEAT repeat protein
MSTEAKPTVLMFLMNSIQQAIADPSPEAAHRARVAGMIIALDGQQSSWMAPTLAGYIGNSQMPEAVVTGASNALSGMGMAAANNLQTLLTSPDQAVRFAALNVFRLMRPVPTEAIPFLAPVLADAHPTLRANTLELLERLGPEGAAIIQKAGLSQAGQGPPLFQQDASFANVLAFLSNSDAPTRLQACEVLLKRPEAAQVFPLLQQLVTSDPDGKVRDCALNGIVNHLPWTPELTETYRKALSDTAPEVRADAARAFENASEVPATIVPDLILLMQKEHDISMRMLSGQVTEGYKASREALRKNGSQEALDALKTVENATSPTAAGTAPTHPHSAKSSGMATLVFFLIMLIIIGGALLRFLRAMP